MVSRCRSYDSAVNECAARIESVRVGIASMAREIAAVAMATRTFSGTAAAALSAPDALDPPHPVERRRVRTTTGYRGPLRPIGEVNVAGDDVDSGTLNLHTAQGHDTMMTLLRLIHVLGGIAWVGSMFFMMFFLFPAFQGEPATMGKVMQGLGKRRFMQIMPVIAILTILSGLWMIWITSGGDIRTYASTGAGKYFTMAGGLAIIAFLTGIFIGRPMGMKAAALGQAMATASEAERGKLQEQMAALQQKSGVVNGLVAALLVLSAAGMGVARYL